MHRWPQGSPRVSGANDREGIAEIYAAGFFRLVAMRYAAVLMAIKITRESGAEVFRTLNHHQNRSPDVVEVLMELVADFTCTSATRVYHDLYTVLRKKLRGAPLHGGVSILG